MMTDTEWDGVLEVLSDARMLGLRDAVRQERAHIAALTAERDALQKKWDGAETELNAIQREANAAGAERDALRERVQALEKEVTEANEGRRKVLGDLGVAERHLAAIRQRYENQTRTGNVLADVYADTEKACMMQHPKPAPDAVHRQALINCVRSVVDPKDMGEDGTGSGRSHEGDGSPVEAAEPTTAEAFATVQQEVDAMASSLNMPETFRKVTRLLSLLERRMGAMGRAIRDAGEALERGELRSMRETLASALTDTTPVFTLEEVERALAVAKVGTSDAPRADPALVLRTLREMRR